MSEVRQKLEAFEVDMVCDCGNGRMRPTGQVKTMSPVLYVHSCTHCNKQVNYRVRYPYVRHEPVVERSRGGVPYLGDREL